MTRTQIWISLGLNAFLALFALGCIAAFFVRGGQGNMKVRGARALSFFTVDSNLFCALTCLCASIWDLGALKQGGGVLPRWLDLLRFVGSASVAVTFVTVLLYLLPITKFDFRLMYAGRNLFLHGLCPLAAMGNWVFLERGEPLAFGWTLLGLVPTALYAAFYLRMVLIKRKWEDFYGFNKGGAWYLSLPLMLLLSYGISVGLWVLRSRTLGAPNLFLTFPAFDL